jgi:hypothetical protein
MCFFFVCRPLERYTELGGERQKVHRMNTFVCSKIVYTSTSCSETHLCIVVGLHLYYRCGVIPSLVGGVYDIIVVANENATIVSFSYLPVIFSGIIDITISHGDTPLTRIIKDTCLQC